MGFDSSTNHRAYAPNALVACHMNVGSGGKQPIMRDGWYIDKAGQRVIQVMHVNGVAKGLKMVLKERGLITAKSKKNQEELTEMMAAQADFLEQRRLLQEWVERRGHICLFLPKFHPELSCIEMVWSSWKRMLRKLCDGTYDSLRANVHIALRVPLVLMKFARTNDIANDTTRPTEKVWMVMRPQRLSTSHIAASHPTRTKLH